jgi:serine/threonine-protein kinase ATR
MSVSDEEAVITPFRTIIFNYLTRPSDPDSESLAFDAVSHTLTENGSIIPPDLLEESFSVFLSYLLNYKSAKLNEDSIPIVLLFLEYLSALQRHNFLNLWIQFVRESAILAHGKCVFWLTILDLCISRYNLADLAVIETILMLLGSEHLGVQIAAVKCLAAFEEASITGRFRIVVGLMQIPSVAGTRLIACFPEADELMSYCLGVCLGGMPERVRALVVREVLKSYAGLEYLSGSVFFSSVMRQIEWFVEFDPENVSLVGPMMLKTMKLYCGVPDYIRVCGVIANIDSDFAATVLGQCGTDPGTVLLRAVLNPKAILTAQDFEAIVPDLLYKVACNAPLISEPLGLLLVQSLSGTPPKPSQVSKLYRYMLADIFEYEANVILEIVKSNNTLINTHLDYLQKYAQDTGNVPLSSFVVAKRPKTAPFFTKFFVTIQDNGNLWDIPFFPRAFCLVNEVAPDRMKVRADLFDWLVEQNQPNVFLALAEEADLWLPFLSQLCDAIREGKERAGRAAFAVLREINPALFREIYTAHSYYMAFFIWDLIRAGDSRIANILMASCFPNFHDAHTTTHTSSLTLQYFETEIVAYLVARQDLAGLEEFVTTTKDTIPNCLHANLPVIFLCLLTSLPAKESAGALKFLQKILAKKTWDLLEPNMAVVGPRMVLSLGHPIKDVCQQTEESFEKIQRLDNPPGLGAFWEKRFLGISVEFTRILSEKVSPLKSYIIRALIASVRFLAPLFAKYYAKILFLIEIAMQEPRLRQDSLRFSQLLFNEISNPAIFSLVLRPVVALFLPYVSRHPTEVTEILHRFIVGFRPATQGSFAHIAFIPLFAQQKELADIYAVLLQDLPEKTRFCDQLSKLAALLETPNPQFRRLLLKQILRALQANVTNRQDLVLDVAGSVLHQLWGALSHERVSEHFILYARCMCFLPYVRDAGPPVRTRKVYEDHASFMRTLISEFLVRGLEDATTTLHHDHAATSIQWLLKELGCNRGDFHANENWREFSPEVQAMILPFCTSRYTRPPVPDVSLEHPIADKTRKFDHWFSDFTLAILRAALNAKSCPSFLLCCASAVPDSLSLCKFLLPYLCHLSAGDASAREFIRREWVALVALLDTKLHDFAKLALQALFELFDDLSVWEIYAGMKPPRSSWTALGVANELQLSEIASSCDLYPRALMHLELHIRDRGEDWRAHQKPLISVYEFLDDADGLVALCPGSLAADDALPLAERLALLPRADLALKREAVQMLLHSGRYERAFTDGLQIKGSLVSDPEVDSVIAQAAVRLGRWDSLRRLCFTDSGGGQSAIDIALARLLFDARRGFPIRRARAAARARLERSFIAASRASYQQLIPVLAQFRLLEDITTIRNGEPVPWEKEIPLKWVDMERIVAARCALLDDSHLVVKQWLRLANFTRKSGDLSKSAIFSERARQFASTETDTAACSLEMAKTYWDLGRHNKAITLLDSITSQESTLRGKVSFLRAKWAQEAQSAEAHAICKNYADSATLLPNCGKAFFAMASFADQRVMSRLQNNEIIDQKGARARPVRSVFWGTSSNPGPTGEFLLEQMPLLVENYLKSLQLSYATHEVVPRLLVIFFDLGKQLKSSTPGQPEDRNPFGALGQDEKDAVFKEMTAKFAGAKDVSRSVWVGAITQLISRIDLPSPLDKYLFSLITFAFLEHPHAVLWHLMSVHHSIRQERPDKFKEIWEVISHELLNSGIENYLSLKEQFQIVTKGLITLAGLDKAHFQDGWTRETSEVCPELATNLGKCHLLMPRISTLSRADPGHDTIQDIADTIVALRSHGCPKKLTLIASSGERHRYLCKLGEDLRKDMRMMEFASFVNHILSQDRQCHQRDLVIMTFAVICLNERCAMIEWVADTCELRMIVENLISEDHKGLPDNILKELLCAGKGSSRRLCELRRTNFVTKILPEYPPVMHRWLVTSFRGVRQWFETRLRYTRSVAVWSMVGYVLGLGDRHPENILFSQRTGGCVHVDFSILLDRGKLLMVPETVPFRLTQNIVDGMGVLKTDGVFAASARLVVERLRFRKRGVVAVLTTFVNDPLLEWRAQDEEQVNLEARMTLSEIEDRLTGWSEDRSTIRSPECVVAQLIEQATSIDALSNMYIWWQPWI